MTLSWARGLVKGCRPLPVGEETENYIAIRIPGKDADSVLNAMQSLREEFGDKFSQVFKTITVDNGSEFSTFSLVENWGSAVYFAHPYTSWNVPKTGVTMGCSEPSCPRVPPLNPSLQSTSCLLLMS